ncbi:MAG: hypothetical protein M3Z04_10570 [Chloroflexota bacterium]|nr:hypothetical protein [Chloroflexota bacterium]
MSTATVPAIPPQTAARPNPIPVEEPVPGRDLALFIVLLIASDVSGLLHIYGLSWLYGEATFLGLGWLMVTIAALLLLLPARSRPAWLQFPLRRGRDGAILMAVTMPLALTGAFLFSALSNPPAWVARDPHRDSSPLGLVTGVLVQVVTLAAVPALAGAVAYARRPATRRAWIAALAGGLATLSLVNLLYGAGVGKHAPDTWTILLGTGWPTTLGLSAIFAAIGGLVLLRPARFLAATVGAGCALRVLGMLAIPLTIRLGDMLPLISMASTRLLHGQNPYIIYRMPWELPLTYWPLTVLSYLPTAAAGLDLRWTNLLFGPLVGALLLWAGGRGGPGAAGYAFGLLYLAPTSLQWDISTAAPPYWAWLCLAFAATVAAGRHRHAMTHAPTAANGRAGKCVSSRAGDWGVGAAAGLALAAAPLAWPFLPFLGLHWLTRGWRVAVRRSLSAALVAALLVGPFLVWDTAGFWNGAVAWFNDLDRLPLLKWQTDKSWRFEIGLAGPFWTAGAQSWLKPLQMVLIGGLICAALAQRLRPLTTPAAALRWGAAAYLLFMVVNPVIWPYLYAPALLALVFALLPSPPEFLIHEGHEDSRRTAQDFDPRRAVQTREE